MVTRLTIPPWHMISGVIFTKFILSLKLFFNYLPFTSGFGLGHCNGILSILDDVF